MSHRTDDATDLELCRKLYLKFSDSLFDGEQPPANGDWRKIYAALMSDLTSFVEAAAGTDERPYVPMIEPNGEKGYHPSAVAKRYFKRIPTFIMIVAVLSKRYSHSEHIEIFREACVALGLDDPATIRDDNWHPMTFLHPSGMDGAATFNGLCSFIRRNWATEGYKAQFLRRQQDTKNRSKDYQGYIDAWFKKLAKLIVLRIDLSYKPAHWETTTFDDLNADFERLVNNARHNKIFKGWRGHIAKIEYGLGKGIHMHLILLFDTESKQARAHVHLAQKIGEYWNNVVTKGRGAYWNCNGDTKKYQAWGKLGIGPIHVEDREFIRNLKYYVVDYLCKMDQFIRPKGAKGVQLIRRGNWPKPEPKKLGAPRKHRAKSMTTQHVTDADSLAKAVDRLGF